MTAPLVTADDCPACGRVHGAPTSWPQCPEHGHWMYENGLTDAGWAYACQAWQCPHTHTQQERATMTTATEAATAALAIRDGQDFWDGKQLAALTQLGVEGAPQGDLAVFFHYCQATGLDPFAKQIRLRKDRHKVNGEWQESWSIETEIDGYRVIAHRAAKRDGVTLSYGPPKWYDRAGGAHDIWLGDEPPAGASLTVYKDSAPFPAVIRFKSFAKYTSAGQLMAQWATMPDHMIAKCAEAQALRKAFPHDLEGIRVSDEPDRITAPPLTVQQEPPKAVAAPRQRPPQRRAPANGGKVTEALNTAIGKRFDKMDITDPDERDNWLHRLAGKPNGEELTDHDLRGALGDLAHLDDLEALVKWCTPEDAS